MPAQILTMLLGVPGMGLGPREAIQAKGVRPRVLVVFRAAISMRQTEWRVSKFDKAVAHGSCAKD